MANPRRRHLPGDRRRHAGRRHAARHRAGPPGAGRRPVAIPSCSACAAYWHEAQDRLDAAAIDLATRQRPGAVRRRASWRRWARCLSKLGRSPEALILLDEALRLPPDLAAAHYERGFALEQTGALLRRQGVL